MKQRISAVLRIEKHALRAEIFADPVANHRFCRLPHVEMRVERARHAFHNNHGLLKHQKLGAGFHVEKLGHFEQQCQKLGHGNGLCRLAVDRLANGADGLREACHIMRMRNVACLEMHFGHTQIITRDEAIENFGQKAPLLLVEPPGDAKVHCDDEPLRIHEQIARMHIGMEEAVAQRMAQEGLDQRFGKLAKVETRCFKRGNIRHLDTVDPFERQHVTTGALPIHLRNAETFIALDVFGDFGKRCRFKTQIHLDAGRLLQRLDDLDGAQAAREGHMALLHPRDHVETFKIAGETLADAGTDDLDGNLLAPSVLHHLRRMHLRHGSSGNRRIELQVKIVDLAAKRTFDSSNGISLREEVEPVLQKFKVGSHIAADNIGPRRQKLSELYIGWTELIHGPRHAFGALHVACARTRQNACDLVPECRKTGQPLNRKCTDHAFACQNPSGPHQPESSGKIAHALTPKTDRCTIKASSRSEAQQCRR